MNDNWKSHILVLTLCGCAGAITVAISVALFYEIVSADQYLGFAGMVLGGFLALLRVGPRLTDTRREVDGSTRAHRDDPGAAAPGS